LTVNSAIDALFTSVARESNHNLAISLSRSALRRLKNVLLAAFYLSKNLLTLLCTDGSAFGICGRLQVQDVLWSDPGLLRDRGVEVPNRDRGGAGCVFGGYLVTEFLERHGLHRLVRSHQVMPNGAERVELPAPTRLDEEGQPVPRDDGVIFEQWTVFSASQYPNGQGANGAAVLSLPSEYGANAQILSWKELVAVDHDEGGWSEDSDPLMKRKVIDNVTSVLWRHAHKLTEAWEEMEQLERDVPAGFLEASLWAKVLSSVVGMRPEVWHALLPLLGGVRQGRGHNARTIEVNYRQQVRLVDAEYHRTNRGKHSVVAQGGAAGAITGLYSDPENISAMFAILDRDRDGEVTYSEFERVVNKLNESSQEGGATLEYSTNCASNLGGVAFLDVGLLWGLLDQDRSGSISLNELAEGTRSAEV